MFPGGRGHNVRERGTGERRDAGAAAPAGSRPGGHVATPGPLATTSMKAARANVGAMWAIWGGKRLRRDAVAVGHNDSRTVQRIASIEQQLLDFLIPPG